MDREARAPGLDCSLDHEYSTEQWRAFVQCAREGMHSGARLHHEFDAKMVEHEIAPREVERAVNMKASLAYFESRGTPRLLLWDPSRRMVVVGTVPDGFVLTAYRLADSRDHEEYIGRLDGMRWLKR
jgi:hypothetical protein